MSSINIKEYIPDKTSWFNIKRFKINGLNDNFSQKTIDLPNTSKKLIEKSNLPNNRDFIFEKSKKVKDIENIKEITSSSDDEKIKDFFGWQKWAEDKFKIINLTFQFNPYKSIKKVDDIAGFFNYYYAFSNNILCVPNIRIEISNLSDDEKSERTKIKIIDINEYLKFVNETYEFLNKKNKKHIFVPISLRFSTEDLDKIIDYYIDKEYFYYWIDFEGKAIDTTRIARILHINRRIDDKKRLGDVIFYFTNIKREIGGHIKDEKNPASDVLATLFGANIVGVNREVPRKIEGPIPKIAYENKARVFEDKTYYYAKTKDKEFLTKKSNFTNNALILDKEFTNQKKHFLDNLKISDYLKTKEMLTSFKKGKILSEINKELLKSKIKQKGLFD